MTFYDLVMNNLAEALGDAGLDAVIPELQFVGTSATLYVYDAAQSAAVQALDGKDGLTVGVYMDRQGTCWRLSIARA